MEFGACITVTKLSSDSNEGLTTSPIFRISYLSHMHALQLPLAVDPAS